MRQNNFYKVVLESCDNKKSDYSVKKISVDFCLPGLNEFHYRDVLRSAIDYACLVLE